MIIFGTRSKSRTIGSGRFTCPRCRAERPYTRKQLRPYFALYFVPLFPVGQGREYIECQTCGAAFEPAVLNYRIPEPKLDLAAQINRVRVRLEEGTPVEYVIRDLTGAGLDWEVARTTVNAQLGPERKSCRACGLDYAPAVEVCTVCRGPLQNITRLET
jgi:hypothetical protein